MGEDTPPWCSMRDPSPHPTRRRSLTGIGLRTAGVAVADFSRDFSVYPYPDRTIRINLRRATPATDWLLGGAEFRARWRRDRR